MLSPVFSLPRFRVGPYTLKATPATKAMFYDKRRVVENDFDRGIVLIAKHLSTRRTIECLMRSMVTAIHYRSGLNDNCDEEAFTHSLATGLVEMAHNNPDFWVQFQQLLEDDYCPGTSWGRIAMDESLDHELKRPSHVTFDGVECSLTWVSQRKWANMNHMGVYWLKQNRIEFLAGLRGSNLALVVMHEVLHFLHERVGLKDRTKESPFKLAQSYTLLRFIQQNPEFWRWWLAHTRRSVQEEQLLAA